MTRKVFLCPQCSQKLRVPIRPGRVLEVNCKSCHSNFRLDFKIPLIEALRWQSGKSLKLNLVDLKNRLWNLSLRTKIELLALLFVTGLILGHFFLDFKKVTDQEFSSDTTSAVRSI